VGFPSPILSVEKYVAFEKQSTDENSINIKACKVIMNTNLE
jgi:hypothetical protein